MKFLVLASIVLAASLVAAGGGGKKGCQKCDRKNVVPPTPIRLFRFAPISPAISVPATVDYAERAKKGDCDEAIATCPMSPGYTVTLVNTAKDELATSFTTLYRSLTCDDNGMWKAVDKTNSPKDANGLQCVYARPI